MNEDKETVLVLRTCKNDLTSFGGFQWKDSGIVECNTFVNDFQCGNGLHGFLWGEGDGELANWHPDSDAKWLVVKVAKNDIVNLFGKVKFPKCIVVFCGNRKDATDYIIQNGAKGKKVIGANVSSGKNETSISGYRGHSTSAEKGISISGDKGTSISGDWGSSTSESRGTSISGRYGTSISGGWGKSISKDYGTSTSGYYGKSTSGDYGRSTSERYGYAISGHHGVSITEDYGYSTSGNCGMSIAGDEGMAQAGENGILIIKYWSIFHQTFKIHTAHVGENGIKPNTAYRLNHNQQFVEAFLEIELSDSN